MLNNDFTAAINKILNGKTADTVFLTYQDRDSNKCTFHAFIKNGNQWQQAFECRGYLGRNGVDMHPEYRQEGSMTTPQGIYSIGEKFGICDNPGGLSCSYTKVDEEDYWDGDCKSPTYNTHVRGCDMPDNWNRGASEHLIDYKESYNYAAMINFNVDPIIPARGSAIFLHCTRKGSDGSAGCVCIPQENMLAALRLMKNDTYIIIARSIEEYQK